MADYPRRPGGHGHGVPGGVSGGCGCPTQVAGELLLNYLLTFRNKGGVPLRNASELSVESNSGAFICRGCLLKSFEVPEVGSLAIDLDGSAPPFVPLVPMNAFDA
jgi:hypothetical protein